MDKFVPSLCKMGYILGYGNDCSKYGNLIQKKQEACGFIPEHAKIVHIEVSGGGKDSVNINIPKSKHIDITKTHAGRFVRIMKPILPDEHLLEHPNTYGKIAYYSALACNLPYDIRGVLSFMFSWIKQNPRLPFCSEWAAWSIQQVYPAYFDYEKPSKIMPAHFCLSKWTEVIFEGIIPKISD